MKIKRIFNRDQPNLPAKVEPGPLANRVGGALSSLKQTIFAAAEQMVLSRQSLWNRMIDPRRDYDKEFGYPCEILPEQYKQFYKRHGVAQRVVAVYPKECWAKRPDLYETEKSDETEFEKAFDALQQRINLWYHLARADVVSGIGRFGVILLGLSDGKDLEQPVGLTAKPVGNAAPSPGASTTPKLELLFLRVFDESVVTVNAKEADTRSPRFGQPTMYTVLFEDEVKGGSVQRSRKVHWTRVIHIADNCLESEVNGTPRMEIVFNRLIDLIKVIGGGGEMFWRGALPGYSFEALPGITDQDIDKDSVRDEVEAYSNGLQRFLSMVGLTVKPLDQQVVDPTPTVGAILQDICITIEVPKRVFMGSEQGELASTEDSSRWNNRLQGRCEGHVTPRVIRPVVDRLIQVGVLPAPKDDYVVKWPDRNTSTNSEKADVALKKTQAFSQYVSGNVDQLIPPAEYLTQIHGMDPEEVDAIMRSAEQYLAEGNDLGGADPNVLPGDGSQVDPTQIPGQPPVPPKPPVPPVKKPQNKKGK